MRHKQFFTEALLKKSISNILNALNEEVHRIGKEPDGAYFASSVFSRVISPLEKLEKEPFVIKIRLTKHQFVNFMTPASFNADVRGIYKELKKLGEDEQSKRVKNLDLKIAKLQVIFNAQLSGAIEILAGSYMLPGQLYAIRFSVEHNPALWIIKMDTNTAKKRQDMFRTLDKDVNELVREVMYYHGQRKVLKYKKIQKTF